MIGRFCALYPDTEVELLYLPSYTERLIAMAATGTMPDVVRLASEQAQSFYASGFLLPIDGFLTSERYDLSDFLDLDYSRYQGRLYALPRGGGGQRVHVTYYNRDALDQAGLAHPVFDIGRPDAAWSWDDVVTYGKKLTIRAADGTVERWGFAFNYDRWQDWVWSHGGQLARRDHAGVYTLSLNEPAGSEAIQWLADLILVHQIAPRRSEGGGMPGLFTSGRSPLVFHLTSNIHIMQASIGEAFDWSITGVPRGRAGAIGYKNFNITAISSQTKEAQLAWSFLKFLTSREMVAFESVEKNLWFPSRRSVALSPRYLRFDGPPWDRGAAVAGDSRKIEFSDHLEQTRILDLLRRTVREVFDGKQSARTALSGIKEQVNAIFRE
jgi:ABC-type glycerol-3-phosphate transport system substrate-binding protein